MAEYDSCDVAYHVSCLEREGRLLGEAAARAGLDAPVPGCPGWQARDVLAHIGYVHRWAAGIVADGRREPDRSTATEAELLRLAPGDGSLLGWYADGHAALVRVLAEAAPDLSCWSFLPAPSPVAFWARRQAHETAIHRVDAQQAEAAAAGAGYLDPVAPAFAADGVDELLQGFLARNMRHGRWRGRPGVLAIHAEDGTAGQAHWRVVTGARESSVSAGTGPADCDVIGPAGSLYLALWNRGPSARLEVRGDAGLLADLRDGLQVTWR